MFHIFSIISNIFILLYTNYYFNDKQAEPCNNNIMEKVDAGKSTPKELVRLRQEGMSDKEVARMVGLPVQTTSEYYSRCKKEGEAFFG